MSEDSGQSPSDESVGRRMSAAVFAFEQSIIVTFLVMMVVTYVLTVLWNNAQLQYDQFDQLLLKIAGYSNPEVTPPESLATITGLVSPIVLALLLFGLSYLAIRTRERSTAELGDDVPPSTSAFVKVLNKAFSPLALIRKTGVRRLVWAALITAGLWGFVQLVSALPSWALCLVALFGLAAVGATAAFSKGLAAIVGAIDKHAMLGFALGLGAGVGLGLAVGAGTLGLLSFGAGLLGLVARFLPAVPSLVAGGLAGLALTSGLYAFDGGEAFGFIGTALGLIVFVSDLGVPLGGIVGGVVGSGLMSWYFIAKAGPQYDWTSGLTAILLLYVGFIGASMATHDGRHITVDMVRKNIKSHAFHLYNAVGDFVTVLFTGFLGYMAIRFLVDMRVAGEQHAASGLSAWVAVIPIGFGFTMMIVRFGIRIGASLASWRRREPAPELAPELH
ncbi:MAG: TRAP transporter small permease [Deltaproteobacteria bacterium]|nr:TRAP transporter small permease [Deltaproteobacteria bacterium]